MTNDCRRHFGAAHDGSADLNVVAIGEHQNFGAFEGGAFVELQAINEQLGAVFNAVLFAANADNCEHNVSSLAF
jgi:hypothetical protein